MTTAKGLTEIGGSTGQTEKQGHGAQLEQQHHFGSISKRHYEIHPFDSLANARPGSMANCKLALD